MLQNLDSSIEDQIQQLERLQREISESGGDEATISPLQVKFIMSLFTTTVDRCFFFCQRIYFAPSNTIIASLNRWRWWSKQPARWPTVSPRLPLNTGRRRSWAKHFYYPIYHQINIFTTLSIIIQGTPLICEQSWKGGRQKLCGRLWLDSKGGGEIWSSVSNVQSALTQVFSGPNKERLLVEVILQHFYRQVNSAPVKVTNNISH